MLRGVIDVGCSSIIQIDRCQETTRDPAKVQEQDLQLLTYSSCTDDIHPPVLIIINPRYRNQKRHQFWEKHKKYSRCVAPFVKDA